ncbi:Ig-like domain-containing protein [Archangium sp.]|uniref:Ig-like domain-containing protein n=1 Tax=Archangium sp. TaxID=1872627 RepID=UPI002D5BAD19|nr:Ig-like domain-containing protein [Archangium sp.]HYO53142.1 Ig-like domain-containing protein [Archangium sp.]
MAGRVTLVPGEWLVRLVMLRWMGVLCAGVLCAGCGLWKLSAPSWVQGNPTVANDNHPRLRAHAEAGRNLQVFAQPDCQGAPLLQVLANENGLAELELSVADDTTTTLSLRVMGDERSSDCSEPFVYTEDSRAPQAPQWAVDNPVLSNVPAPTLKATAEPGSQVVIHASTDCSGPELAAATADDSGAVSLKPSVASDSITRFSLRAWDAAGNRSECSDVFTHENDHTPPSNVKRLGFSPESPANHNAPVLAGTAEPGTRVQVFLSAYCYNTPVLTAPVDAEGHFEVTLAVKDDSSTYFSVQALDAAGNTSGCESTSAYTEDSTPSAAPSGLALSYTSPHSSRSISVSGNAEAGLQVLLFTREGCTGAPAASTTVSAYYSSFTVTTSVPENTATPLHLATQDRAGNRSKCVGPLVYVHDDVPPDTEGVKVSDGPGEDLRHQVVAHVAEAHWEGFTDAHGIVQYEHYLSLSSICSGYQTGLPEPRTTTQTSARLTGLSLADNRTYFHCVRAKDAAGNWSPYVASDGFRVDLSPPIVSSTTPRADAVEVDILAPVRFTFSEAVDVSSIVPDSLTLEVNGTRVATTVACEALATSCAFTPVSPLPYRETVRATLAATVKDEAGRVMTSPVGISFTTRGREWRAPREVRSVRPGLFPDVAIDGQGRALAVWVQGTASGAYRPFSSRSTPHASWEPAHELDTLHPGDVERPAVAVNEAGFGVAVWELHDGVRVDLYAAEYTPGTGWSEPRLLETRDEPVSTPRVGVDTEGNALVVWRQSDGTAESLWAARRVKGSGWGSPLLLEMDAGATSVPALALEGSGRAVTAWLQPDSGGTVCVRASRFVPGSGWTPPEQAAASGEGTSVSAALSAEGSALLLFRGGDADLGASLFSTRFVPGEGWSTKATRLGSAPPGGDDPSVAMDRWGRAMAAWSRPGTGSGTWYLSVSRFTPEEGWRSVSLVTWMASQPSVASDGQGNFHIVWVENEDGSDRVFAARYPEGATAISSRLAIEPVHGGTSKRPRARANGAGAATTVWYRDNGGGFSSNLVYAASYE